MKPHYRMSEAGMCTRALSATRLEHTPMPYTEDALRAFKESKRHEEWVVEDLRAQGYEIERAGVCSICKDDGLQDEREGIHVELELPLLVLIGHMDGRVSKSGSDPVLLSVLEIKALNQTGYFKFADHGFSAFKPYADQFTGYMQASKLPGLYVVKNKNSGKMLVQKHPQPPSSLDELVDKLLWVQTNVRNGKLVDEEDCYGERRHWCRFRFMCSGGSVESEHAEVEDPEAKAALEEWAKWDAVREEAEARIDYPKSIVVKFLRSQGARSRVASGPHSAVFYGERRRKTVDERALRGVVPDEVLDAAVKWSAPWDDVRLRTRKGD